MPSSFELDTIIAVMTGENGDVRWRSRCGNETSQRKGLCRKQEEGFLACTTSSDFPCTTQHLTQSRIRKAGTIRCLRDILGKHDNSGKEAGNSQASDPVVSLGLFAGVVPLLPGILEVKCRI